MTLLARTAKQKKQPLNVLLFTADDLNCDSVGCFGGKVSGLTPNLDSFASQGIRFERAHVNVAICQPSRGILATGRYGHNSGIMGFMHTDRDRVFTQIDMKVDGDAVPMRCVQDKRFGYIFTPWSDGKFYYRNNNEGLTMKAMIEAASADPIIAQRVKMFRYRVLEEFYDLENDPDCLKNLIGESGYEDEVKRMQSYLCEWMEKTRDPLLPAFRNRYSRGKLRSALVDMYGDNYIKAGHRKK